MVSDELWCCWVLYRELNAGGYEELLSGGVGFAQSQLPRVPFARTCKSTWRSSGVLRGGSLEGRRWGHS